MTTKKDKPVQVERDTLDMLERELDRLNNWITSAKTVIDESSELAFALSCRVSELKGDLS